MQYKIFHIHHFVLKCCIDFGEDTSINISYINVSQKHCIKENIFFEVWVLKARCVLLGTHELGRCFAGYNYIYVSFLVYLS